MTPVQLIWLQFSVCVAAIGIAGPELCRNGDVIAEKCGLSSSWVGLILLASITSLPELVTGASAVTMAHAPNIAIGDVLGSCVFNLVILVVLDFLQRGENVYRRAQLGHVVTAAFGVVLIGWVGMNVLLQHDGLAFVLGSVGSYTPVICLLYVLAIRTAFFYEREHRAEFAEKIARRYPNRSLRTALLRYAASAIVIVATGTWLPFIARDLASLTGWHTSFVGTLLVAAATSAPELAVTVAALRIGALDMAIANLLGSNLFDMLIVAIDDVLWRDGPILAHVSTIHAVSALSATIMTGIVIIGLLYRPKTRVFKTIGWISFGLFFMYLMNTYILYLYGE